MFIVSKLFLDQCLQRGFWVNRCLKNIKWFSIKKKKVVGFYKEIGEYDIQENVSKGNFGRSLPWILVGILVLCLAILGTIFYKKLPFIKRKKIANELEDDFVYELAVKKNQEENDKNKIFNS